MMRYASLKPILIIILGTAIQVLYFLEYAVCVRHGFVMYVEVHMQLIEEIPHRAIETESV